MIVAAVAGRHSLIARSPVFDGLQAAPPYRWISPPPSLAAANRPPASGRFQIPLDPTAGSLAAVYSTSDNQVNVSVAQGGILPAGQDSALLTITALDPARFGPGPPGLDLVGNVYRLAATYRPSGRPISRLSQTGQLSLFYPAPPNLLSFHHTVLRSTDGRSWAPLSSIDSPVSQQVQANVAVFGYFVVGQSKVGAPSHSNPVLRNLSTILLVAGFGLLALWLLRVEPRVRRTGRPGRGKGREKGKSKVKRGSSTGGGRPSGRSVRGSPGRKSGRGSGKPSP